MSLEQGIVALVGSDPTVASLATRGGGFLAELPKGFLNPDGSLVAGPPSWTYIRAGGTADYTLQNERGPRDTRIQIDVYGVGGASAINLATAIDNVLSGFSGTFYDNASPPNAVGVMSCLEAQEPVDIFDATSRTWRRRLEYRVMYQA